MKKVILGLAACLYIYTNQIHGTFSEEIVIEKIIDDADLTPHY